MYSRTELVISWPRRKREKKEVRSHCPPDTTKILGYLSRSYLLEISQYHIGIVLRTKPLIYVNL